ncbi:hypothetical protein K435DRAFT_965284 [Dendrothele bispora CBS 962.96]|uniref:DUF6533 domain-containing protein n=1 Tax=Dendrothele bispora (strain CBS 962.96) TaxID=1314807 RepID=A0A4V4HG71_DENBC|nr:hypothetical protein K435DRAFT_965284 [Dendrothele bispora CBS 962.96]
MESVNEQRYEEYFHLLGIAFLYWDHIITFATEVGFLWKHFGSMSSYMFFLNRYFSSLGVIAVTYSLFSDSMTETSCKSFHSYRQILLVLTQVFVCILLTLRIYALYGRSLRMLVYMLSFGFFLAGVACFALFFGERSVSSVSGMGCHTELQVVTAIQVASAWEALFIYDLMLVIMTLKKAYQTRRELKEERNLLPSILVLVVRDGSIYFVVMAIANLLNILTFYLTGPYMRGGLSTFASAVSVTMMSRMMLNLHSVAETGLYTSHQETCQFGTQSGFLTYLSD